MSRETSSENVSNNDTAGDNRSLSKTSNILVSPGTTDLKRLLRGGALLVWYAFWLTWLVLAVIDNKLGSFKFVTIVSISLLLFTTYIASMILNLSGRERFF